MKDDFENQINRLKSKPIPACPGNLEANVLRRIRLETGTEQDAGLFSLLALLIPRANFAFFSLALVVLMSSVASMAATKAMATDRQTELNRAFGFNSISDSTIIEFDLD